MGPFLQILVSVVAALVVGVVVTQSTGAIWEGTLQELLRATGF